MSKLPKPSRTFRSIVKATEEEQRRQRSTSPFVGSGQSIIDPGQIMQEGSWTIPNNGLLLVDGGDVVMLNESLVEVFRLGLMTYGDRGISIRRDDGTEALRMRALLAGGAQVMQMLDRNGDVIAGGSLFSPGGFDVPFQDLPFHPVDYTSGALAQTTSSATFVATHEHYGYRQNPAMDPVIKVKCSDATTSAEVQVWSVLNSVYLGGFLGSPVTHTITVPTGTTTFTPFQFSSALLLPGTTTGQALQLEIHVRRTAGAGSVSVAPVRTVGGGF